MEGCQTRKFSNSFCTLKPELLMYLCMKLQRLFNLLFPFDASLVGRAVSIPALKCP